jgi:hypothetical protein
MKTGQVIKSASIQGGELELINKYSRREMSEDEVYVFTVVLCDNDVDRDCERFTVESLYNLEKLFVGKTGVFDHNPKAQNQTARIISCKVEAVYGKKNSLGDDYFRLVARAYMPNSEKNKDLILSLDSGITKEVSVGCAVEETRCSICGNNLNSGECSHIKGESYNGKLCYGELINPYDAYEWSFVAVPAQKEAGVIKAFNRKERTMTDIIKSIENSEAVTLTEKDSKKLNEYINGLKKQAADGVVYKNSLIADVLKYSAIVQPEISRKTMESVAEHLSIDELKEFRLAYMNKSEEFLPPKPQLFREKAKSNNTNTEFKI